jgi:hypothetical protein
MLDTLGDAHDYVADHTEVYGGMHVSGEVVIVSFTSDVDEHSEGLRASVEHPELVRVACGLPPRLLSAEVGDGPHDQCEDLGGPAVGAGESCRRKPSGPIGLP